MTSMLYNQNVQIDCESEPDGTEHERDVDYAPKYRDERANVQQVTSADRDTNGARRSKSEFVFFFDRAAVREGDRIIWTDLARRKWVVVVESVRDMAGRNRVWKATGSASVPR